MNENTMLKEGITQVCAFAPASSSNFSVGYDLLGFPFAALGDEVTLTFNASKQITISGIDSVKPLPLDPKKNTATHALMAMCHFLNLKQGVNVYIKKGIPLCSGLGGSAASAVAAVFALNACLKEPLDKHRLASFAIDAEALASGEAHADNVVPSLWGQLTLVRQVKPLDVIALPMPMLYCVLIHPHIEISTKAAREALQATIGLHSFVKQSANLAGLISSLYVKDWSLLKRSTNDCIIESQRAHLLPGFEKIKSAGENAGALCCSFSGAGPTLYALAETKEVAQNVLDRMQAQCLMQGMACDAWIGLLAENGPQIVSF